MTTTTTETIVQRTLDTFREQVHGTYVDNTIGTDSHMRVVQLEHGFNPGVETMSICVEDANGSAIAGGWVHADPATGDATFELDGGLSYPERIETPAAEGLVRNMGHALVARIAFDVSVPGQVHNALINA